jgi:hypothetical protein
MTKFARAYNSIYPVLIMFSICSILVTLIGLGLWMYQVLGGHQINWMWFVLWGFAGCWIFPGLTITLGVWVAKLESAEQ